MGDAPMNYPHITGAGIGIPTTADFCSRLADLRSLELIRMRDTAAAVLESVLSLSNPALDHLVVALMTEPPFDVLDALRNAGTQLLSLIIDSYELPMRGLPEFIAGQRRLEKIVARTEFSKENRGLLPEFVASCAGIVNLRQLRVSPMALGYSRPSSLDRVVTSAEVALMRNSCMPLRARDVTVNIFGEFQYSSLYFAVFAVSRGVFDMRSGSVTDMFRAGRGTSLRKKPCNSPSSNAVRDFVRMRHNVMFQSDTMHVKNNWDSLIDVRRVNTFKGNVTIRIRLLKMFIAYVAELIHDFAIIAVRFCDTQSSNNDNLDLRSFVC
eukprot:IDg11701t1